MRLWHIDLIPVLPNNQLSGQWKELGSIYKNQNRHLLINFVYDRQFSYKVPLYIYSKIVIQELDKRGYKYKLDNFNKFFAELTCKEFIDSRRIVPNPYAIKMDDEYLTECYFNLREKYNCGGITEEEWSKIHNLVYRRVYNWVTNNIK